MHILLINTNPVVSRLVSLCVRHDETVLDEVAELASGVRGEYDLVLVDDASYVSNMQESLAKLNCRKSVFLSGKHTPETDLEYFDEVLRKPFLPSQITAVMETLPERRETPSAEEKEEEEERKDEETLETTEEVQEHFIFPLSSDDTSEAESDEKEESAEEAETTLQDDAQEAEEEETEEEEGPVTVLNSAELERIKALLDEDDETDILVELSTDEDYEARKVEVITEHLEADGLEIVSEDDIAALANKKKEKKLKKKKRKKEAKSETYSFEEALIAAIEGMKPKKIRKLLKDAEISIQINFKDKA